MRSLCGVHSCFLMRTKNWSTCAFVHKECLPHALAPGDEILEKECQSGFRAACDKDTEQPSQTKGLPGLSRQYTNHKGRRGWSDHRGPQRPLGRDHSAPAKLEVCPAGCGGGTSRFLCPVLGLLRVSAGLWSQCPLICCQYDWTNHRHDCCGLRHKSSDI